MPKAKRETGTRRAHEHEYRRHGNRGVCALCGFSVPADLIACVACGALTVVTVRVFAGNSGPYCSAKCAEHRLA